MAMKRASRIRSSQGSSLADVIRALATTPATPISLSDLFKFGRDEHAIAKAAFLHRELPIRFSQRVQELSSLPNGLSSQKGIQDTRDLYLKFVGELMSTQQPTDPRTSEDFKQAVRRLLEVEDQHQVVKTMALAVRDYYDDKRVDCSAKLAPSSMWHHPHNGLQRLSLVEDDIIRLSCDDALNRFFMSRIGLRFITEQFLHSDPDRRKPGWSGVLNSRCNAAHIADMAAEDARRLARFHLGACPDIHVSEQGARRGDTFTYIPKHIHYILLELIKNAVRAVTTSSDSRHAADMPRVEVVVVHGQEDVTIKICDRGGGIPRSEMDSVWTFMYSTAPTPKAITERGDHGDSSLAPSVKERPQAAAGAIAGYGVGLPMSRLYARYFGGDLDIKSVEGLGTDCYLHLPKLGHNCENLPDMVKTSPGELDSTLSHDAQ